MQTCSPGTPTWQIHPAPLEEFEHGTLLTPLVLQHGSLANPPFQPPGLSHFGAAADLTYAYQSRTLKISQEGISAQAENLDTLAAGQLAMAQKFYDALHPIFGWIDEYGTNLPSEESVRSEKVKYLFWANFFGPGYVQKLGRAFLLRAPGWKKIELDDGGLLYVPEQRFERWRAEPQPEVLRYFGSRVPEIQAFCPSPSPDESLDLLDVLETIGEAGIPIRIKGDAGDIDDIGFSEPDFDHLELFLYECSGVGASGRAGAERLLSVLGEAGGKFLRLRGGRRNEPAWEVDPRPEVLIQEDGRLSWPDFGHPLLERSPMAPVALDDFPPTSAISYLGDTTVSFSQSASLENPDNLDALARAQLDLLQALYRRLRPHYGFIDEREGDWDPVKLHKRLRQDVCRVRVPNFFWANLFGAPYIAKYGRELFMNAPGWKKLELDDGGILYVITASYLEWRRQPSKEVLGYFRSRLPTVEPYTAWDHFAG
jgi:hypothetical protein